MLARKLPKTTHKGALSQEQDFLTNPHVLGLLKTTLSRDLNYLWTYDLYGPVCNVFDGGKSHYKGQWKGWAMKVETFWALKQLE